MPGTLNRLDRYVARSPARIAVSEYSGIGRTARTGAWLYAAARTVAARAQARRVPGSAAPVVVVLDGSADSIAVLLGHLFAAADVLCLEQGTTHLADRQSAIWRTGPCAVIEPADYQEWLRPVTAAAATGTAGAPEVLQLTSGSTGEPRIVRQSVASILTGAELYRRLYRYGEIDKVLVPLPVAHSFGLVGGLMAALVAGAELLTTPAFSLRALRSALADGATVLLGTPLLYAMLIRSMPTDLRASRLRVLLSSGGPMAGEVEAEVRAQAGQPVWQVYGSTETGLIASQGTTRDTWATASAGIFAPGVCWALAPEEPEDTGEPCPAAPPAGAPDRNAQAGRLLVRTRTMFSGYAGEPARDPALYYDTGDLAAVSADGEVFLLGRKNTFVNVGGRKVNPRRVERIIGEHPGVGAIHVFGMPSHHEQAVHAAIEPATGHEDLLAQDVASFCLGKLAHYETPHRFHILSRLPRGSLGKVDLPALHAAIAGQPQRPAGPPACGDK